MRSMLIPLITLLIVMPTLVLGQSDGTAPPSDHNPVEDTPAVSTPIDEGSAAQVTVSESGSVPEPGTLPVSSSPKDETFASTTTAPASSTHVPAESAADTVPEEPVAATTITLDSAAIETTVEPKAQEDTAWKWLLLTMLALVPFGFFGANYLKKKPSQPEESDTRCFDIKQMMEEKLRELTDVRAVIESNAKGIAKDAVRDSVSGTAAGDLLVRLEKLEAQYSKLKALYEECQIDAESYAYKGVVFENSLFDKKILDKVNVIDTREMGEQMLRYIRLSKTQIEELQKNLVDETGYFHVWEPGKDQVLVVFKNKTFSITHSEPQTWNEAIAYGEARGIPRIQLDFRII